MQIGRGILGRRERESEKGEGGEKGEGRRDKCQYIEWNRQHVAW